MHLKAHRKTTHGCYSSRRSTVPLSRKLWLCHAYRTFSCLKEFHIPIIFTALMQFYLQGFLRIWHHDDTFRKNHHNYASKSNSDPHAPEWPPTQHLRGFLRWLWAQMQPNAFFFFFLPALKFCELAVFLHSNRRHLMCMYDMIGQNICKIEIYTAGCTRACPSCIIQTRAPEPCSAALLTWQFIFVWCPLQTRFTLKSAWTVEGGGWKKENAMPSLHNNQHLKCKSAPDDDDEEEEETRPVLVVSVLNQWFC